MSLLCTLIKSMNVCVWDSELASATSAVNYYYSEQGHLERGTEDAFNTITALSYSTMHSSVPSVFVLFAQSTCENRRTCVYTHSEQWVHMHVIDAYCLHVYTCTHHWADSSLHWTPRYTGRCYSGKCLHWSRNSHHMASRPGLHSQLHGAHHIARVILLLL